VAPSDQRGGLVLTIGLAWRPGEGRSLRIDAGS
jgi:hypothetical protein